MPWVWEKGNRYWAKPKEFDRHPYLEKKETRRDPFPESKQTLRESAILDDTDGRPILRWKRLFCYWCNYLDALDPQDGRDLWKETKLKQAEEEEGVEETWKFLQKETLRCKKAAYQLLKERNEKVRAKRHQTWRERKAGGKWPWGSSNALHTDG